MLLNCPHCETVFRIKVGEMPAEGRNVRCSVCRHVWKARRGRPGVITENSDLRHRFRRLWMSLLGGLVIIGCAAMLIYQRNIISAAVPSLVPFYESAGLSIGTANRYLEVGDLDAVRADDTVRLVGEITNKAIWPVHAPRLKVTVADKAGEVLAEKVFGLDTAIIARRETFRFQAQVHLEEEISPDQVTDIVVILLPERSHR